MMTKAATTPQEAFWSGEFGDEYTVRNDGAHGGEDGGALVSRT